MLPKTYLAQLTPPRIAEALRRIEPQIWTTVPATCAVTQTESSREFRTFAEMQKAKLAFKPVPAAPFHWGPKYAQRWFHVTLPKTAASTAKAQLYFIWEDQGEATIYIKGEPYYGLDIAHRQCPLPAGVTEFHLESACIRTGIWLDGTAPVLCEEGSEYRAPRLVRRNDDAWHAFHDLRVLLDVIEYEMQQTQPPPPPASGKAITDPVRYCPPLLRAKPYVRRWLNRIDKALDVLDNKGLAAFRAELRKIYADSPADNSENFKATLTGHAHIDLVWLWPERVGEFKTVHSWANAMHMFTQYPEMRFGFSQPHAYRAMARRAPGLHKRMQKFVATKQWDAVGAAYVESDTHLPCGEALLRSLQLGQDEFAKVRGGKKSTVFWLPDVFGYSGCVPQLLKGVGVTGFYTSKISWSGITKFPHTSFRWRGIDGTEVAAHISLHHDYNECVGIRNLREDALGHQQAGVHPEALIPTGYGDGGGGPTEAMCERARRVANLTGVPKTGWGNIEDFFTRLIAVQNDLPVMTGELAVENHRGVFTTHARLKSAFRGLERALQVREAVHIAKKLGPVPVETWRRIVFAQFHDYIPGSSIWEVYSETIPELETLAKETLAASATALAKASASAGATKPAAFFNPLPIARNWLCADGSVLEIGPLQSAAITAARKITAPAVDAKSLSLRSENITAAFTQNGALKKLVINGQPVRLENDGHALWHYPDYPCTSPAWDVDQPTIANGEPVTRAKTNPVVATASGSASIAFDYKMPNGNTARVAYELRAGENVMRVRYTIDIRAPHTLVKAVVSTDYKGNSARFACPFGSVLRTQVPSYPREEAQWEVPGSRWMILTDNAQSEGLAVITKDKYGFTMRDGAVGVSLMRSAFVTEADMHPQIRTTPDRPRYSDIGVHETEIAIGRYTPDMPATEHPANLADTLYTDCVPCESADISTGLRTIETTASVAPAWAKPIDANTWVLRLQETDGRHATAKLTLADGWRAAKTTLSDDVPTNAKWTPGTATITLAPCEVVAVMLQKE